ncbi:MAG TPA: NAD-dependent epimerase/dehydratase family protein [Ferruginibacter sp.]|jgi:dihydroflavonol-4-reductase|nr:NAD-dependent epimerase/dehydratase family protein [Ferruginibacter sp.]
MQLNSESSGGILVTGGSGLVGNELITQLLAQGKSIRAIYNKTPLADFNSPLLKQIHCDILDVIGLEEAMQGITQVYHCAAIVSFSPKRTAALFKINVEGTANVVNAALDAGVQKFVHISSVAALGKFEDKATITETTTWVEDVNSSIYGKSKYFGELEVWRGVSEGMNAVIVNPTVILGPGDWNEGSSKIFKSVHDDFPWYSEGVTGFVDVKDVARAMIQLMDSNIVNERFIISGGNKSFRDVLNLIAKAFGKKEPHKKVTPFLAAVVWRLEALKTVFSQQSPLITRETATAALAEVNFDTTKLSQFLPDFTYTPIEETITYTVAALQQKLNSK